MWRVNWPIVGAFLAVATQWRTPVPLPDGRVLYQGLDYTAVRAGLEQLAIALTPAQFRGLQTMERAAAAALNGG